jgi:hypothetical protein
MRAMKKLTLVAVLFLAIGCKDKNQGGGGSTSGGGGTAATGGGGGGASAETVVGMTDPFARLSGDNNKEFQKALKAQHAKKWDDAASSFRTVVSGAPDYAPARWFLVRTLVLGGQFKDVPQAFEQLLAVDYLGYVNKLDKGKEFAALRNAPEWSKINDLKTKYRDAYAKGLDSGFVFVARVRPASDPSFDGGKTEAALNLQQEAFHYDPATKRYRRLTNSDGHTFAVNRLDDKKRVVFLLAPKLHRESGKDTFVDPQGGVLDLTTLEMTGPYAMKGQFSTISMGADAAGTPRWSGTDGAAKPVSFTFDTAKTSMVKIDKEEEIAGSDTLVFPDRVLHDSGKKLDGVEISDGATQFKVSGVASPIVVAKPLSAASVDWSPGKARLTYAGKLDACKLLANAGAGDKGDKNELYVYDLAKKSAQRVSAAISYFETLWLDDDSLVYEGGIGKKGQLHVYAFGSHADSTLATKYGAGLYGVPTLSCEKAEGDEGTVEPAEDEDVGD